MYCNKNDELKDNTARLTITITILLIAFICLYLGFLSAPNFALLALLALLSILCFLSTKFKFISLRGITCWLTLIMVGLASAIYQPSGFTYPLVWQVPSLYDGGSAFQLYANSGKGLGGLLMLIWCYRRRAKGELATLDKKALLACTGIAFFGAATIILFASLLFGLAFIPKWPEGIIVFIVFNLCFTVLAEEVFFRSVVQSGLQRLFAFTGKERAISILIVSILFGIAHAPITHNLFPLFLFAGFIYAAVFSQTQRLSMAILCHFSVNIIHILFFEYPL